MKLLKACPIIIGTLLITIALSVTAFVGEKGAYAEYASEYDAGTMPLFVLVFKGLSEGVYPWSESNVTETATVTEKVAAPAEEGQKQDKPANADALEVKRPDSFDYTVSGNFANIGTEPSVSGNSISGNDPDRTYEFTHVEDDYFDDALFIGDSRTVGLSEYCPALDERATFYAKVSLTIYSVMDKQFINSGDSKISVEQALSEQQFGKIYIMLGINEMGTGTTQYFADAYTEVINRIRELQPDAMIFIQGIMHVTEKKSSTDKYFNNQNIDERNEAISQLADNKNIFYMDMNESVDDGNGNLDDTLTFDDVHLKASSYERWYEFLLDHGIVKD